MYPFERFTNEAKGVLALAQEEAERSRLAYIGTEHLVIGLIRQEGLGASMLASSGVTVDKVRAEVDLLRAAGITEHVGEPPTRMHRKRRHFELADARGETIEVDLAFPPEYSEEDCQAVTDRIKAVFRGP